MAKGRWRSATNRPFKSDLCPLVCFCVYSVTARYIRTASPVTTPCDRDDCRNTKAPCSRDDCRNTKAPCSRDDCVIKGSCQFQNCDLKSPYKYLDGGGGFQSFIFNGVPLRATRPPTQTTARRATQGTTTPGTYVHDSTSRGAWPNILCT